MHILHPYHSSSHLHNEPLPSRESGPFRHPLLRKLFQAGPSGPAFFLRFVLPFEPERALGLCPGTMASRGMRRLREHGG